MNEITWVTPKGNIALKSEVADEVEMACNKYGKAFDKSDKLQVLDELNEYQFDYFELALLIDATCGGMLPDGVRQKVTNAITTFNTIKEF